MAPRPGDRRHLRHLRHLRRAAGLFHPVLQATHSTAGIYFKRLSDTRTCRTLPAPGPSASAGPTSSLRPGRLVEFQSIGRDITLRKEGEVERLRTERRMQERQRIEGLGSGGARARRDRGAGERRWPRPAGRRVGAFAARADVVSCGDARWMDCLCGGRGVDGSWDRSGRLRRQRERWWWFRWGELRGRRRGRRSVRGEVLPGPLSRGEHLRWQPLQAALHLAQRVFLPASRQRRIASLRLREAGHRRWPE